MDFQDLLSPAGRSARAREEDRDQLDRVAAGKKTSGRGTGGWVGRRPIPAALKRPPVEARRWERDDPGVDRDATRATQAILAKSEDVLKLPGAAERPCGEQGWQPVPRGVRWSREIGAAGRRGAGGRGAVQAASLCQPGLRTGTWYLTTSAPSSSSAFFLDRAQSARPPRTCFTYS